MLFHPGFSTAPAKTELAGRGVGLDVVAPISTFSTARSTFKAPAARNQVHLESSFDPDHLSSFIHSRGGTSFALHSPS